MRHRIESTQHRIELKQYHLAHHSLEILKITGGAQ